MVGRISYKMTRGELWDRLIMVKNRRTRRVIRPSQARAMVDLGTSKKAIPLEITKEGGIYLRFEPDETLDFSVGTFEFDVVAPIRSYWQVVAKGIIEVSNPDNITPYQDGQQMEVRLKKGEDYRNTFSWTDDNGDLVTVTDAYMQAKDTDGNTVLDLRWYATVPSEATISGLTGNRRGYLAPYEGETLELHISDMNTITAGSYPFDLFVKRADGDWKFLSGGTVVVEASVSTRPT